MASAQSRRSRALRIGGGRREIGRRGIIGVRGFPPRQIGTSRLPIGGGFGEE